MPSPSVREQLEAELRRIEQQAKDQKLQVLEEWFRGYQEEVAPRTPAPGTPEDGLSIMVRRVIHDIGPGTVFNAQDVENGLKELGKEFPTKRVQRWLHRLYKSEQISVTHPTQRGVLSDYQWNGRTPLKVREGL